MKRDCLVPPGAKGLSHCRKPTPSDQRQYTSYVDNKLSTKGQCIKLATSC